MPRLSNFLGAIALLSCVTAHAADVDVLHGEYRPLAGEQTVDLHATYAGKVVLVVNTASKCGFTPQYEGLEALHAEYGRRGFAVLGFPSNDFKGQEPGTEKEIRDFCELTYGVKFPMFEKVHVVGPGATPLYATLTKESGTAPGWNFHKYLIDRNGHLVGSFDSKVAPDSHALVKAIEKALGPAKPQP